MTKKPQRSRHPAMSAIIGVEATGLDQCRRVTVYRVDGNEFHPFNEKGAYDAEIDDEDRVGYFRSMDEAVDQARKWACLDHCFSYLVKIETIMFPPNLDNADLVVSLFLEEDVKMEVVRTEEFTPESFVSEVQ